MSLRMVLFSICRRYPAARVLCMLAIGLLSAPLAWADSDDSGYIAVLQQRAAARHVAGTAEWHALMHYEPNWMHGGVHSEVITPWFFLAAGGADDPAAELDADIAALFSRKRIGSRKKPVYCLFPARRKFLIRRLDIDTRRLPNIRCPTYRRWRRMISPDKVSLVFPTAFPNSPSSMFGHTLLRVDSSRRRRGTELLAFAVNFAAAAGKGKRGLGFVWKGLTGGYPGVFGLFPYYKKVKQYAWIENRDVWSYRLDLTPAQLSRLVDHIWEMDSVRFKYYFFNKNCSYQLLSLLDVARPDLHLTAQYSWYAIPSDTIRSIAAVPGLMGPAEYRPSMATTLRWEASQLSAAQRRLAISIADADTPLDSPQLAGLAPADRAGVLEVAYDYLHYSRQSKHVTAKAGKARADAILLARSRIARPSPFVAVPAPAVSPEQGHRSLRVNVSGIYADDNFSLGVRIRPAYHDLLDNPGGYTQGAEINFADLGLRLDPSNARLRIDDFRLLDIVSLSPRDEFFKPLSFRFDTGLRRRPSARVFGNAPNDLGYYLQGGPGLAWGSNRLTGYVFGLGSLDVNESLKPGYAMGAGASAGVLAHPLHGVQLKAEIGGLHYVAGSSGYYRWAKLGAQWPLIDNLAMRANVDYEDTASDNGLRLDLGIQAYF